MNVPLPDGRNGNPGKPAGEDPRGEPSAGNASLQEATPAGLGVRKSVPVIFYAIAKTTFYEWSVIDPMHMKEAQDNKIKSIVFSLMVFFIFVAILEINIVSAEEKDGLFLNPIASVVDSQGFVYVVDNDNHNIQKFDSGGEFVFKWGSENSGGSKFIHPHGISMDSEDNIYVVDQNNGKIKRLADSGYISQSFGRFGFNDGEFGTPTQIALDSEDNIYVVDYGFNIIQKFSQNGTFLFSWGSEGTGDGQFTTPLGIATDSSDNVYVLDESRAYDKQHSRVQKFTSDGEFLTKWSLYGSGGDEKFLDASGIAIDSSDSVYVTDFSGGYLQKFSSDGKFTEKLLIRPDNSGDYSGTSSVAIDRATGNFYVTNSLDKYVSKFSPDGTLLAKWGGEASWEGMIGDGTEPPTQPQDRPGDRDGLYNDGGLSIFFLEKNQRADLVFYLDASSQKNTKAVAKYFLETPDGTILYSGESKIISLGSEESGRPIVLPFSWTQSGSFSLRHFVEYADGFGSLSVPYGDVRHIVIVDTIGKAAGGDGLCKKESLVPFVKHDYSKIVCVSYQTSLELSHRGW